MTYLDMIGKTGSPNYINCPGVPDGAEQIFFRCPRWETSNQEATHSPGAFPVVTVFDKMIDGEVNWDCLSHLVQSIFRSKYIIYDLDLKKD